MHVLYSPQRDDHFYYHVEGEAIYLQYLGAKGKIDFINVPDGRLEDYDFPFRVIISAEKKDGQLTVTIIQPLDPTGEPLQSRQIVDFEGFSSIDFTWKTWEEIEEEKNAPKPPTQEDRLAALEAAMLEVILGGKL